MKKYLIISFLILTGCTSLDVEKEIVNDSIDIVDGYVETLETSVSDAREVKKMMESNNLKLNYEIK